jgi:hypothetical protein
MSAVSRNFTLRDLRPELEILLPKTKWGDIMIQFGRLAVSRQCDVTPPSAIASAALSIPGNRSICVQLSPTVRSNAHAQRSNE